MHTALPRGALPTPLDGVYEDTTEPPQRKPRLRS
jgi:hypothetical protein